MGGASLKDKLIEDIVTLPEKKVKDVINFVKYLKLKEDDRFINLVNKRGKLAKTEKKAGKRLTQLQELQKQYK